MKILKTLGISTILILFTTLSAFAQMQGQQMPDMPTSDDVSDEELTLFVQTIQDVEPIQTELQGKVEQMLADEDMTMERFQQLMMAMQNPQMASQVNMSDEEQETIQQIQPELNSMQMEAQENIVAKIEDNGMDLQRYQAIMMAVQQDQELLDRLRSELELEDEEDN